MGGEGEGKKLYLPANKLAKQKGGERRAREMGQLKTGA